MLDHLTPSNAREPDLVGPAGWLDLRDALKEAYRLRSRYVHNLKGLPDILSEDLSYSETIRTDHTIFLTIQGLARVARQVILEFVARQPKLETEAYDYGLERYGVVRAQVAPQYWIGRPGALDPDSGRQSLEGFLQAVRRPTVFEIHDNGSEHGDGQDRGTSSSP